jgi:hypothetical protein
MSQPPGLHARNRVPLICGDERFALGALPEASAPWIRSADEGLRPTSGTEGLSPTVLAAIQRSMRVEAFNQHVVVGCAVPTITNRAFNDARRLRIGVRIADRFPARHRVAVD